MAFSNLKKYNFKDFFINNRLCVQFVKGLEWVYTGLYKEFCEAQEA